MSRTHPLWGSGCWKDPVPLNRNLQRSLQVEPSVKAPLGLVRDMGCCPDHTLSWIHGTGKRPALQLVNQLTVLLIFHQAALWIGHILILFVSTTKKKNLKISIRKKRRWGIKRIKYWRLSDPMAFKCLIPNQKKNYVLDHNLEHIWHPYYTVMHSYFFIFKSLEKNFWLAA